MGIRSKSISFTALNMLGCVGWLDEDEGEMTGKRKNTCLALGTNCRKTCGWTQCNMRCPLQHRDSRHFSLISFSRENKSANFRIHDRTIRKAV